MKNNKIWFVRKIYGYGWIPSKWEGWLVLILWAVIFIPLTVIFEYHFILSIIGIIVICILLIYVCYKKGEKLRWQWGKKENEKTY